MMIQKEEVQRAVLVLRSGGLLGLPTETVYGLAADASNPLALQKIFAAKGRPSDHPLIVHLAKDEPLTLWARDIPPVARQLAEAFWPGPLTLILKKQPHVLDLVTGGQDTVGVRVPAHPLAQAVLEAFGGAVAAPSANRFGRISPTVAEAVCEELGDAVDYVLEGGPSEGGIESTIVDCTGGAPVILRPGMISATDIEAILHQKVLRGSHNAPRVPGSHCSHYAPKTPAELIPGDQLEERLRQLTEKEGPQVVLLHAHRHLPAHPLIHQIVMPESAVAYAHDLYQTLRSLDRQHFRSIWIEGVPASAEWEAIRDRLMRAAVRGAQ